MNKGVGRVRFHCDSQSESNLKWSFYTLKEIIW